jgi:transcriptional regulator with XRE-family HTH domain
VENDFGKKILIVAKEKYGSQKNLAKALGMAETTISGWITGRIYPSLEVLRDICIKTETSLDWLVLGKSFHHDSVEVNLFNKTTALAYDFALEENIAINGAYFLAVYDFICIEMENNKKNGIKQHISEIFERMKPIILKLKK